MNAQVAVDGIRGGEWTGVTPDNVPFSAVPSAGFVAYSEFVSIDVYFRTDATHLYALFEAKPAGLGLDNWSVGLDFANVYFNTNNAGGSDLGFELTNNRAFIPGVAGYYNGLDTAGVVWSVNVGSNYSPGPAVGTIIEFAVPWTFFTSDPLSVGFAPLVFGDPKVQLRSIQTLGYTFIGADSFGADRFGQAAVPAAASAVPEPSTYAAMGALALVAIVGMRRLRGVRA